MTRVPKKCVRRHDKPAFSVSEAQSTLTFRNPSRYAVRQVQVDDCVFKKGTAQKRCDWLVHVDAVNLSVLAELKGGNVEEAYPQWVGTHEALQAHLNGREKWVVNCSSVPAVSPQAQRLMLLATIDYGAEVIVLDENNTDLMENSRPDPPYTFTLR